MEITKFHEKLNKVDGKVYVIEEEIRMPESGVYEAPLQHDNITVSTLNVYTGPKLTGNRIQTYVLTTPSLTPWKRIIRIQTEEPVVYITYETDGDTVEAEDVNCLQDAVTETQEGVKEEENRAKAAEEALDCAIEAETGRATAAEEKLEVELETETVRARKQEEEISRNLSSEEMRAVNAEADIRNVLKAEESRAAAEEKILTDNLAEEVNRAESAEKTITDALEAEVERAATAEKKLEGELNAEITRAKAAETGNADNLAAESARAESEEKTIKDDLSGEIARAKAAEQKLTDDLGTETGRAEKAEKILADDISVETNRAKAAEEANLNAINTEKNRAAAAEEAIRSTISGNKPNWDDKYTRNEVDNKFSVLETAIDWKEAVNTYSDLETTYPEPEDGWTVNVKDTDYTYRWNGTKWIAISANAIPKATQSVDGLLSKEDKVSYDDAYSKRHTHTNKSTLDKLTQVLLDNWNAAYSHISNKSNPHGVTKEQVGLGNVPDVTTNNQTPTFTQAAELDIITSGEKLSVILGKIAKAIADFVSHKSDADRHITGTERVNWNDADSKKHTHGNKSVVDRLTQSMLDKLAGIASGAQANVQSDWNETETGSDAYIKNKPASMPASDVADWAKADAKPSYGWTEITGKPGTFPPSSHTHTKSQISDMPTKVSQFSNDAGYLTSADVDTSQNHTHANKTVLDKVTQAMMDKLAGIAEGANKYVHPTTAGNKHIPSGGASGQILRWSADGTAVWGADKDTVYTHPSTHPGSMISEDATHRFLRDYCKTITDWNDAVTNGLYMASGATNAPASGWFFGRVIAHTSSYVYQEAYQFTASADAKAVPKYIRCKMNGTWGEWTNVTVSISVPSNAKFTDTVYSHPNSGATAGTYKSVTVNAQGHVTGGSNPTTLAGYGITDAAAKSHNHDSTYLKKGSLTWADLGGG